MQACLVSARDLFAFSGEVVLFLFLDCQCARLVSEESYHLVSLGTALPTIPSNHDDSMKVHRNYPVVTKFSFPTSPICENL